MNPDTPGFACRDVLIRGLEFPGCGQGLRYRRVKKKSPCLKEGGEASRGSRGKPSYCRNYWHKTLGSAIVLPYFQEKEETFIIFSRYADLLWEIRAFGQKKSPCLKEDQEQQGLKEGCRLPCLPPSEQQRI